MVLEGLGKSLRSALDRITGATSIDEQLIKDVVKDLQRALLQADVNVQLVLALTKKIEERALGEKPPAGKSPKDHVVRIIYDELVSLLDNGEGLKMRPQTIMMVGLYGQGKTTSTGKLAYLFNKRGFNVGLIAADVYRPAAYDQLRQLGEKVGVEVYGEPGESDAPGIVKRGMEHFREKKIVIIDTSGRHALEDDLIQEIKDIANVAKPDERFLVLDSQVGQQAGPQAEAFHNAVGVTGVILTKMDGTAKGGGAISAISKTNARIVCIGVGEHIRDFEPFDANKFISRLLGMGDLSSLVEMAKEGYEGQEVQMEEAGKKILSGKFTLRDMYQQMQAMNKMGPLKKIMSLIPGMSKMEDKIDFEESQKRLAKYKYIMDSMTLEEQENPEIIKSSRVQRIAMGSGTSVQDVRELLKQFNQSKKALKGMTGNRKLRKQMMKQMGMTDLDLDSLE
ncbi:MAG: signal recognition particle protein Srp54 [Candidatus Methanomethylophilaceae archaeon]|nr:signal recognition particle protein Srp54 [Candidatus Methanomethylophilaceae archaeon]